MSFYLQMFNLIDDHCVLNKKYPKNDNRQIKLEVGFVTCLLIKPITLILASNIRDRVLFYCRRYDSQLTIVNKT